MAYRHQNAANGRIISHDNGGQDWDTTGVWIAFYNTSGGALFAARANQFPEIKAGITAGTDHIAVCNAYGSTMASWFDGTAGGTAAHGAGNLNSSGLRFGGNASYGYSGVSIAEAFAISGPLTQQVRQSAEGYLAHKYGLTGNLPANHPYKTNAP